MQTVILAGGLGTRLRPLTYKIPKVMAPIKGKPFLEYILALLKKNNLKDVILCVGYLGEKIKEYFQNDDKLGIRIQYSFDSSKGELLGTGGALKNAEGILDEEFIILNGDTFLEIDHTNLVAFFHQSKKLGTMVVFENSPKIMKNNIKINKSFIVENYDKKTEGDSNCVDAGVQIFKKEILKFIPFGKKVSLEKEIFPILIKKGKISAYVSKNRFYDIGTFEKLKIFESAI